MPLEIHFHPCTHTTLSNIGWVSKLPLISCTMYISHIFDQESNMNIDYSPRAGWAEIGTSDLPVHIKSYYLYNTSKIDAHTYWALLAIYCFALRQDLNRRPSGPISRKHWVYHCRQGWNSSWGGLSWLKTFYQLRQNVIQCHLYSIYWSIPMKQTQIYISKTTIQYVIDWNIFFFFLINHNLDLVK